jgi:hypothetical protein
VKNKPTGFYRIFKVPISTIQIEERIYKITIRIAYFILFNYFWSLRLETVSHIPEIRNAVETIPKT